MNSEKENRMSTRNIIHVDIPSRNREESGQFYRELFGWKITPVPGLEYSVWESGEGSRGGFPAVGKDVKVGDTRIYVDSEDIEADLKKAKALGAEILREKTEIPGRGWYGIFKDPTGNTIGLFTRKLKP
jgi:predicted enzyme related to lactoylglutathione lyase